MTLAIALIIQRLGQILATFGRGHLAAALDGVAEGDLVDVLPDPVDQRPVQRDRRYFVLDHQDPGRDEILEHRAIEIETSIGRVTEDYRHVWASMQGRARNVPRAAWPSRWAGQPSSLIHHRVT